MTTAVANNEVVTENDEESAVSTADLLTGILDDLRLLVEKQFLLMQSQVEVAFRRRLFGAMVVGIGCAVLLVAGTIGSFGLAHWIHWLVNPAEISATSLPLWACEGLVSISLMVIGAIAIQIGKLRLAGSQTAPNESERIS